MNRTRMMLAAAAAGLLMAALPAGTAVADDRGAGLADTCSQYRTSWSGAVIAWEDTWCTGTRLGIAYGNDVNWSDGSGPFQGSDNDRASSVMNNGTWDANGLVHVAFYRDAGGGDAWRNGYACLKQGQYVGNLAQRVFVGGGGGEVADAISSHQWVTFEACSSWM
ncbi:hypothetical protein ACIQI7_21145 [Kitasatospora sp. NPDC092039]|uniref:hypothetical protein n=1 Tax=Kitasatospora sp. NPDC092039 TaxID=3364086 RepID=UPI0037FBD0F8